MCHHCSLEVRRGKVGTAKKDCGNRGMQQHLERQHKEGMASVAEARARNNAEALGSLMTRVMKLFEYVHTSI